MRISSMDECSSSQPTRPRWADDDDDNDDDLILPPRQVIGPDQDGIKKVIEHKLNDENKLVRITTTTRVRKVADARLSKRGVERRAWRKFGHAVNEEAAGAKLTVVSTEDILLERPLPYGIYFFCLLLMCGVGFYVRKIVLYLRTVVLQY